MRQTLKIVLPLIVSVVVISLLFAVYQMRLQKRTLQSDLSHRAETLGENFQDTVAPAFRGAPDRELQRLTERMVQREHLEGVEIYDAHGKGIISTVGLDHFFDNQPDAATRAVQGDAGVGQFTTVAGMPVHIYAMPLHRNGQLSGSFVL